MMDTSSIVVSSQSSSSPLSSITTASTVIGNRETQQHLIQMMPESSRQQQIPITASNNVIDDRSLQQQSSSLISNTSNNNNNILGQTSTATFTTSTATLNESIVPGPVNLPIKLGASTQPILVSNQGIIAAPSAASPMASSFVSYILPAQNSLQKSSISKPSNVSQSPVIAASPSNISETLPTTTLLNTPIVINPTTTTDRTSIATPQKLVTSNNSANVKLIQTANPRHLVFSSIKPAIGNVGSKPLMPNKSAIGAKSNLRIADAKANDPQPQQFASSTTILAAATNPAQQQQQQLIILSPVKPPGNLTAKTTQFIPSIKFLPTSSTAASVTTSEPSKRPVAPVPITKTIISTNARPIQSTASNKNVQLISFVPINPVQQINAAAIGAASTGQATTKFVPIKQSKLSPAVKPPNLVQVTGQKVLVSPNPIKISGTATESATTSTNVTPSITKNKNSSASVWMLAKPITTKANDSIKETPSKNNSKFVPIAPNPANTASTIDIESPKITNDNNSATKNISINGMEESRRKPCNCTRSQCLKLYCDCFANGEFCSNCNCVSCCNNLENEDLRQKAIRSCLDRNPNAFHPKIGQSNHGDIERRHTKGCCCKRSGCLKNYCECYEAKILCSDKCKCIGCKNFEESDERKTLLHLVDVTAVQSPHQQAIASKMHVWGPEFKSKLPVRVKSDCHPFNILTNDILETTASCLLAQAEEGEFENLEEENIQSLILDQFGECISQILNLANTAMTDDDGNSEDDNTMADDIDCTN